MTSISWNDLNDSSQLSQASSDDPPPRKIDDKNANLPPTSLQKALSSPEPLPKHKLDSNQKIAENLQKLAKHNDSYVWLFVLNTFNNQDAEAEKILRSIPSFQKTISAGKGFNVYLKKQLAASFIEKGHFEKGISFKMVFSNRNQNGQEKKVQKKYSEKDKQGKNYQVQEIKSPRFKTKQTYTQRNNYPRDDERGDKKKIKYVAKETSQKKSELPPKIIEDANQSSEPSNTERTISNKSDPKIQQQESNFKEEKINQGKNKNEEVKKQEESQSNMVKKQSQLSNQKDQKQEQVKQKKKKNNKKKKGKSGGGGNANFDPNNPFSSLVM